MENINTSQILEETSKVVLNGNGNVERLLVRYKNYLKEDIDFKDEIRNAIKILKKVIALQNELRNKPRGGLINPRRMVISFLIIISLVSLSVVSASINLKMNEESMFYSSSEGPILIKNGLNITTGHVYISAGDLHIDGNLVHDQGDVSFSGGSFDVAGQITATGFISTIFESAAGNLKLQAGANGDVVLFSSADIDNADDGREIKIWRNAPEGNNYIRTYITSTENALTHSNTNILLQNADGKNIQFNSGQHIYLNLGDSAGSDEVRIRDSGGLEVGLIDSNGNVWYRGDLSVGVDSDVLIQANGDSYFNGGFVGIGGLIPNSRFSINGSESTEHGSGSGLAMRNTAIDGDTWYLRTGANGTMTPSGGFSIADTSAYRFVIDENGKIGIGTISPSFKLEVNGNVSLNDALYVVNSGFVGIGTSTPGLPLEVRSADDNQAFFFDSTAQTQGVGGGIAFGGKYSDAGGEAMAGRIGTQKTNGISGNISWDMVFETQDWEGSITERMILTGDGKVGIGEENPTQTLDVNGNITADYFLGDGSQLTGISTKEFFLPAGSGIVDNNAVHEDEAIVLPDGVTFARAYFTFHLPSDFSSMASGYPKIVIMPGVGGGGNVRIQFNTQSGGVGEQLGVRQDSINEYTKAVSSTSNLIIEEDISAAFNDLSLVASDSVQVYIQRDSDDSLDTLGGDLNVVGVIVKYD